MNRFLLSPLVLTVLVLICLVGRATCQVSTVGRELVETVLEQLGRHEASDLAKFGGEAVVREVFEKAAREGGEAATRQLVAYTERYGVAALRACELAPGRMLTAFKGISGDLVEPAIYAAARDPAVVTRLVSEYGEDALALAAKQLGVSSKIAGVLGRDGIEAGLQVSTPQAVRLARYADEIAAAPVPPALRKALLDAIAKAPVRVLDEIERHPKILLTAAGCATLIAIAHDNRDQVFGKPGQPGWADRSLDKVLTAFRSPISAVVGAVGLSMLAWVGARVWLMIRARRALKVVS